MNCQWFDDAARDQRYLVAVSGGLDSVALLHLLHEHEFRDLVVCHVDHGLRGEDSREDRVFVGRLAAKLGYAFRFTEIDLRQQMAAKKQSLETAGREARYEFFAKCAEAFETQKLLMAHHADDQAETVLWNLFRGSSGYRGIGKISRRAEKLQVIRPLLDVRKSELRDYLVQRDLEWREDESNQVNDVVRNRVRNELIPLMDSIAQRDVTVTINKSLVDSEEQRELMAWAQQQIQPLDPQGRLHVPTLRTLPKVLAKSLIVDFLKAQGVADISRELIEECLQMLEPKGPHSVNLPGGDWLRRKEGRLFVKPCES